MYGKLHAGHNASLKALQSDTGISGDGISVYIPSSYVPIYNA